MNDERDCLNFFTSYYHKQVRNGNLDTIFYPISPLYVGFKVTEKCNQFCKHCWAGKSEIEKSTSEIILAIEKLSNFEIMHFTITGGELLIRPDFFEILERSIKLFPIVEVFSNAQNLNEFTIKPINNFERFRLFSNEFRWFKE